MMRLGVSRREVLRIGGLTALGMSLGDWTWLRAWASSSGSTAAQSHDPPAKRVILLWLWGGPSHLDTFDMKPEAPLEYRGPFEPIATTVPGIQICELLPRLARLADSFSLVRSLNHESNDHGVAGTIALTGSIDGAVGLDGVSRGGAIKPSVGSIVARLRGGMEPNAQQEEASGTRAAPPLPPYVILGRPLKQGHKRVVGEGAGGLGTRCEPFRLDDQPGKGVVVPDVELPEGLTYERFQARWDLRSRLRETVGAWDDRIDRHYELARDLIASRSNLEALDLEREPEAIRREYGHHRFGRCCLIARRLAQAGQPFIQVNWSTHVEGPEDAGDGGWDMHDRYFAVMRERHGWMLDQGLSALLNDLKRLGMLESTLVVAVGEFGRTPKINEKAGRDHWNPCYSALLAGGGIAGGRVVGASDRRGERPIDRPVSPADLGSTILDRLGVTTTDLTRIGLTPMGHPIHELF